MKLNEISDRDGARHARKRVGRGPGSGLGKTAGRGMKGQKSRSGVAMKGFEGGQMPIHRRLPKRGFNPLRRNDFNEVGIDRLQTAIDAKKLDPKKPVTIDALVAAGICKRPRDGVRLLANGELKAKIEVEVAGASKGAIAAIEKAGGSVKIVAAVTATEAEKKAQAGAKDAPAAKADDASGGKPAQTEDESS